MSVDINPSAQALPRGRGLRNTGLMFAALGGAALLVPVVASVVVEQVFAAMLLIWGLSGVMFAYVFRGFSEWRLVAVGFVAMALVGLWFLIFPGVGEATMTALLIAAFLVEGILSILLGLRMGGQLANAPWVVASGACAFVLGMVLLFQWPMAAAWLIGALVGLNFLSTGLTLLMVARAAQ